jgi:hypothetical protein
MTSLARSATEIPVIETNRLILRGHRLDDFSDCVAMWSDPIVTRFIGGKPFSEEETWARLLRYAGHWSMMDFGYWAIEEKDTHSFVGESGFADFKRDIEPSIKGMPELGGSCSGGMGRTALWVGANGLHNPAGECRVHPRRRKMRLQRTPTHRLQRPRHDHICPLRRTKIKIPPARPQ